MLKDAGDKLSTSDREPIERAVADVKKALESESGEGLTEAMEALTATQHRAAEAMYKQGSEAASESDQAAAGAAGEGAAPPPDAAEGEVIDAEVVEDKE